MPKVQEGEVYTKKYSEENIQSALEALKNGMSQRQASKMFGVPRQTLQFRTSQKFHNKTSLGPNPILTQDEENILEEWILTSYKKGFPVRKFNVQASVKEFLDANPRENPFRDNLPGEGWYRAFLKRHPALTHRTPEAVTAASSAVSEADIRKWLTMIEEYLRLKGFEDILQDPTRIFNGDETNFFLCPKNTKVIAPRGARNVYEVDTAQAKSNITVMFTFSAAGQVTEPMLIYPYKRLPIAIKTSVPPSWGVGHSDNGWMKIELFYEYIGNVLYPCLKDAGVKFPVILFVDGHSTHQTLKLSELCTNLGIILIALYPNATRIMQPADVAAFKPLKSGWKKAVLEFRRKNPHEVLTKEKFGSVLKTVVDQYAKADTIRNGFRATGLFPWNASAIDYTKCLGEGSKLTEPVENDLHGEKSKEEDISHISYTQFKNIVGEEKINIFEQIDTYNDCNDEFILLYKLYREFKKTNTKVDANDATEPDTRIDIENIEIVFVNGTLPSINLEDQISDKTYEVRELDVLQEEDMETICNKGSIDVPDAPTMTVSPNENDVDEQQLVEQPLVEQPLVEQLLVEQPLVEQPLVEQPLVEQPSSLRNYVMWPKTPERKGKRNSEKLPFVLTSTQWKNIQMEKLELKKQEQERKDIRKTERCLKKFEKEKKVAMKKRKSVKENTEHEGLEKKRKSTLVKVEEKSKTSDSSVHKSDVAVEPNTSNDTRIKILSCVTVKPEQSYVRKLFSEDETQGPEKSKIASPFPNNLSAVGRICFICTKNITNLMKGIKCYKCTRTYHIMCIFKVSSDADPLDLFYCKTCSAKLSDK